MEVAWSPTAGNQLDEIFTFEMKRSQRFAAKVYKAVVEQTEGLAIFPEKGAKELSLECLQLEYRRIVVLRRYKVIYRFNPSEERVDVVAVWDCRQNPETLRDRLL